MVNLILLEKKIYTNFDKIISVIDEIIYKLNALIENNITSKIKELFDGYIKLINKNFELILDIIKNVPVFSNIFQQPLE